MLDNIKDKINSKDAFSTAEMLLVLLIISFLVLAMPPLVHKKFEKNLRRAEHGRYECWRDAATNKVYEFVATEKAGPLDKENMIEVNSEGKKIPVGKDLGEDGKCKFDAQAYAPNAAFFSMQVIGGGAGGSFPPYQLTDQYVKDNYVESRPVALTDYGYDYSDANSCSNCNPYYKSYRSYLKYYEESEVTEWVAKYFTPIKSIAAAKFCSAQGDRGTPGVSISCNNKVGPDGLETNPKTRVCTISLNYGGLGGQGVCYTAPAGSLALGGKIAPVRLFKEDQGWDPDNDYAQEDFANGIGMDTRYVGGKAVCVYYPNGERASDNGTYYTHCTIASGVSKSSNPYVFVAYQAGSGRFKPSTYHIIRAGASGNVDNTDTLLRGDRCRSGVGYLGNCQVYKELEMSGNYSTTVELPNEPEVRYGLRCSKVAHLGHYYPLDHSPSTDEEMADAKEALCQSQNESNDPSQRLGNFYVVAQYYDENEPGALAWTYCKAYPGINGENYDPNEIYTDLISPYPASKPRPLPSFTPNEGFMKEYSFQYAQIPGGITYAPSRLSSWSDNLPLCGAPWVSTPNDSSNMIETLPLSIFPNNITMSQKYSYNTPTYGYAGTPGELANLMLPKFDGNIEVELGRAGAAGTEDSRNGTNGSDTIVWLKSRDLSDNIDCTEDTNGCKYVLTGKGGTSIPGGNVGPRIMLKGEHTCKTVDEDGNVSYITSIHSCLDKGVATIAEAKQRFAVDSGFRTIPEFDKKTKTPSAMSIMYDGDQNFYPGSGGDGGYSFLTYMNGQSLIYSNYAGHINRNALKAMYGEEFVEMEGIVDSGNGISMGGADVDLTEEINNYKCYTRFDDGAEGTGDTADDQMTYTGTNKVKICEPKSGKPGAVVIVW